MPVAPFKETQLTPEPAIVKVTAGVWQNMASAKVSPKASALV